MKEENVFSEYNTVLDNHTKSMRAFTAMLQGGRCMSPDVFRVVDQLTDTWSEVVTSERAQKDIYRDQCQSLLLAVRQAIKIGNENGLSREMKHLEDLCESVTNVPGITGVPMHGSVAGPN